MAGRAVYARALRGVRVARDRLPDHIVARLVAPRLRKGEEETLVAGQSVDRRRRLAAERAVIGVIGDFQPRQIGDIFAPRKVGVDEGAGRSLIACILGAEAIRLRLEAPSILLGPPVAPRAAAVDLASLVVEAVAALLPGPTADSAIVAGADH